MALDYATSAVTRLQQAATDACGARLLDLAWTSWRAGGLAGWDHP